MAFSIYKSSENSYNLEVIDKYAATQKALEDVSEGTTNAAAVVRTDTATPPKFNRWKIMFFLSVVVIFMVLLPVAIWYTVKTSENTIIFLFFFHLTHLSFLFYIRNIPTFVGPGVATTLSFKHVIVVPRFFFIRTLGSSFSLPFLIFPYIFSLRFF